MRCISVTDRIEYNDSSADILNDKGTGNHGIDDLMLIIIIIIIIISARVCDIKNDINSDE